MTQTLVAIILLMAVAQTVATGAEEPAARSSAFLDANVDALAHFSRVESEAVGEGGDPSEIWAAYEIVAKQADRDVILKLLRHPSPIVRTYMAWHVMRKMPADLKHLEPLLDDRTKIETQSGCIVTDQTVATFLADELCWLEHDDAYTLLARVAQRGRSHPVAAMARRCLEENPTKQRPRK